MNRRRFLASLGIGAPAAVLAAKVGLFERARSCFFAPPLRWIADPMQAPGRIDAIRVRDFFRSDAEYKRYLRMTNVDGGDMGRGSAIITNAAWEVLPDGTLATRFPHQSLFAIYDKSGSPSGTYLRYRLRDNGKIDVDEVSLFNPA